MKKILLIVIFALITILTVVTVVNGLQLGGLNVLGITAIKEENSKLDESVKQATKLASTDYSKKLDDLSQTRRNLEIAKTDYEDEISVSTTGEITAATQYYKMNFLWINIENHAKSEGVLLTIVPERSSTGNSDTYNLNFTATGTYIGIAQFIEDLEDDSELGFKIENFKMTGTADSSDQLQATFTCKNIEIEGISNGTSTSSSNMTTGNETETSTFSDRQNTEMEVPDSSMEEVTVE